MLGALVLARGYAGSVLRVDLTSGSIRREPTNEGYARLYVGGRGLGARYLLDYAVPGSDPLSPQNPLVVMTGPFTGTPISSVHKFELLTRSPLTNMYLCSNVGGTFGVELKRAGIDGLILLGKLPKPGCLVILDGEAEIRDASSYWGRDCRETAMMVKRDLGEEVRVMRIGQAGENLVRFANVMSEPERSAGKGGAGAVLGSKNLKAIAVKGSSEVEVADEDGVRELGREVLELIRENPATGLNFRRWGTCHFTRLISEMGIYPFKNFQSVLLGTLGKIDAETWRENYVVKDSSPCYVCSIGCAKTSVISKGKYEGCAVEGPEYESLWALGPNCGIVGCEAPIVANMLCDRLGLDTISTGVTIAFAMECYEKGFLTEAEAGMPIRFGDEQALLSLVEKIAYREGIGNELAEGVRRFAGRMGKASERFAMHCKGMELPAYDPRGVWGMALAYATSCRGGDHLKAWTISDEVTSGKYDRFSTCGKAELVKRIQDLRAVYDSLVNCILAARALTIEVCAKLIEAVTGTGYGVEGLLRCGERIYNLERVIAAIDGISSKDDRLPARIVEDAVDVGIAAGKTLGKENFEKMLRDYYDERGWDGRGLPTERKLAELGMRDVAESIRKMGVKLPASLGREGEGCKPEAPGSTLN
ncbi:MAG: aldehyde ferredoxin oxidoreductase family protein [Candidatus Brockarchaeota archaeon]|nr:aldehyde ferredoxin oxidoreductase family protein [Candidatus Brockarchaeota archaeon]